MTIGIGAVGSNAGLAVWKGLNYVERVTSGSVGGFATFAVMDDEFRVHYYCTQRGGSRTLFTEGDSVLENPPEEVRRATLAAVISSGPDRTEPLTMYLAAEDGVGLVTGHRIPSAIGTDGLPVNQQVIQLMKQGIPADKAVNLVMEKNPQVDAGLIAIGADGTAGLANALRVDRRPDNAKSFCCKNGVGVFVLNNEIYPPQIAADVAAATAFEVMAMERIPDMQISISAGLTVQHGDDRIVINDQNEAVEVYTSDQTVLSGETVCVVPYLSSIVVRKNGKEVGRLMNEPITLLQDGVIIELAGQKRIVRDVATNR